MFNNLETTRSNFYLPTSLDIPTSKVTKSYLLNNFK